MKRKKVALNPFYAEIETASHEQVATYDVEELQVKMWVTRKLLFDSALPKKDIVDILTHDFRKELYNIFGLISPAMDKPKIPPTYGKCFHCKEWFEKDDEIAIIMAYMHDDNNFSIQLKEYADNWKETLKYRDNLFVFHKECFAKVAGKRYDYIWEDDGKPFKS